MRLRPLLPSPVLPNAGTPADPQTYRFGAASGAVWKSLDGGSHRTPLFDHKSTASVGSIAAASSDPDVLYVYVRSGERCLRGNISYGAGGKTWWSPGLSDTQHIPKVLVDPRNPDTAFVAAIGLAFVPNLERGVFRTMDCGKMVDVRVRQQ